MDQLGQEGWLYLAGGRGSHLLRRNLHHSFDSSATDDADPRIKSQVLLDPVLVALLSPSGMQPDRRSWPDSQRTAPEVSHLPSSADSQQMKHSQAFGVIRPTSSSSSLHSPGWCPSSGDRNVNGLDANPLPPGFGFANVDGLGEGAASNG